VRPSAPSASFNCAANCAALCDPAPPTTNAGPFCFNSLASANICCSGIPVASAAAAVDCPPSASRIPCPSASSEPALIRSHWSAIAAVRDSTASAWIK
jgi:hypothetical protein